MKFRGRSKKLFNRETCIELAAGFSKARLFLLMAVLAGLPLALGGRADWTRPAMGLVNAGGFALLFLEAVFARRTLRWHRAWLLAAALPLVFVLQIVPLTQITDLLSPRTAALWQQARDIGLTDVGNRLSLAPVRTRNAVLMLLNIGLTAFLVYNTFTTRPRLFLLALTLIAAAFINALAGFIPIIIDSPPMYADLEITSRPLSGTFLNRNHFGFLLALGLIQLAGVAWILYGFRGGRSSYEHRTYSFETGLARFHRPLLVACALTAVPIGMALLLSLSRGATLTGTAGLVLFTWIVLKRNNAAGLRREIIIPLVLIAGAVVSGSIEALTALKGRYESLMEIGNIGLIGRWNYWGETIQLIRKFPLTGIGLHAFEPVSPMVESGVVPGKVSFHAHNDYLELLAEVGLPAGLLIITLILVCMWLLWRRARRCTDRLYRTLALAGMCALTAAGLHEFVEYNVRAPANGFLVAALAVLVVLAIELDTRRQARRRKGGGVVASGRTNWRRCLFFSSGATALLISGFWFFMPRIQAGNKIMELRGIAMSSKKFNNTGVASRIQADYCASQAASVLQILPANERAHYYQAVYLQILASAVSRQYAGKSVTPEERDKVVKAVLESREAARKLCRYLPTEGYYQAVYAKQLNLSAWYDETVAPTDIIAAFEAAHAVNPNVPQVTWLCIQAFAEVLRVDRDELSQAELARLETAFVDMGRALLEQQPRRTREVLRLLQKIVAKDAALMTVMPERLLCYEALFDHFFRHSNYRLCRQILDKMTKINRTRLTRADDANISLYELARTHPAARAEMRAEITRKRRAVASVTGNWEEYAALRKAEFDTRRQLCAKRLNAAREAADTGDLHRALRIGRQLRADYPGNAHVHIFLTEELLTAGDYYQALECLQPLMWLPTVPAEILQSGIDAAQSLGARQDLGRRAQIVVDTLEARAMARRDTVDPNQCRAVIDRIEARSTEPTTSDPLAHLAFYYAGLLAEKNGRITQAAQLYQQVLTRCPLHYKTLRRVLNMNANAIADMQENVRAQLDSRNIKIDDLHCELVDLAPGVTLREFRVAPPRVEPHDTATINATILVHGTVTNIPPLVLRFTGADGTEFKKVLQESRKNWGLGTGEIKVGQLVKLQTRLIPGAAALNAGEILPDGRVHLSVTGKGRDQGFTFFHPGFLVKPADDGRNTASTKAAGDKNRF